MIPRDKFGNQIYSYIFKTLKENGKFLVNLGYSESTNKPNLFYLRNTQACYYADMRGTEDVAIWNDTRPLFYWKFANSVPNWERRHLLKYELSRLFQTQCSCRLSFYAPRSSIEFENISIFIDTDNGVYDWDIGFCCYCKKDFQNEGEYCSTECRENYKNSLIQECIVCKKKVHSFDDWDTAEALNELCTVCNEKMCFHNSIGHHVNYFPEEIIYVHRGCHNKIHRTNNYPYLKPKQSDIDRFYNKEI